MVSRGTMNEGMDNRELVGHCLGTATCKYPYHKSLLAAGQLSPNASSLHSDLPFLEHRVGALEL